MSCHAQKKPQLPSSPRRASCSCGLSCLSVSSPGGLLIPPNFPREFFFWGGKRVPAVGAGLRGPRPRPQGPPAMASLTPCTAMASRAPTPPPRWNCYGVGHAFREGGVMSVLCRVCLGFPPIVSIFGLFPVLV